MFAKLPTNGTYAEEGMTLTQPEARNIFKSGQAGMILDGSWAAGSFDAENSPVKGKVQVILFPTVSGGKNAMGEYVGSALNTIMVAERTKHKEDAAKAALFIAKNFCQDMYQAGSALPAWKVTVDESKLPALFVAESKLLDNATGNMDSFVSLIDATVLEDFKNAVMEFSAGRKTSAEFMDQVSKLIGKQ
jgi:raffinose/stachyose/melibiose transport system substrate-binding protein